MAPVVPDAAKIRAFDNRQAFEAWLEAQPAAKAQVEQLNAANRYALEMRLEEALERHFGFQIGVVLRTHEALQAMLALAPFAAVPEGADAQFFVLLLAEPLALPPVLQGVAGDYEVARMDPRDIYLVGYRRPNGRYSEGFEQIGKRLPKGLPCTMRNWNTIRKAAAA